MTASATQLRPAAQRSPPADRRTAPTAPRRPHVALVVDHPSRDLSGLVLTAADLCRHGVVCHLVPLNLMHGQIWTLAPDMVVLNYARPNNAVAARQLLDAGMRVGILDTEGAAWETCDAYTELLWPDRALLAKLSFACMWGPVLARHMVTEGLLTEMQAAVTGCPRFDFYHPRWHGVLGGRSTPARPVVLINTNFSFGNPRFASVARNREQMEREFGIDGGRLLDYLEAERAALHGMIELARAAARDFPSCDIVLRPHPFEDPAPYRAALDGCAGITVDAGGPIQTRLLGALAVIQRSCSTAAEAAMAGVPTLSPQWLPAPALIPFAEAVSLPCESYDQLRSRLQRIVSGGGVSGATADAARERLSDWFSHSDGLAYQRVADTIRAHLPASRAVDAERCVAHLYHLHDPHHSTAQRLAARLRFALRLSPAWAFRRWCTADGEEWRTSDKYFGVDDVARLVERICCAMRLQQLDPGALSVTQARADNPRGAPIRSHSVTMQAIT